MGITPHTKSSSGYQEFSSLSAASRRAVCPSPGKSGLQLSHGAIQVCLSPGVAWSGHQPKRLATVRHVATIQVCLPPVVARSGHRPNRLAIARLMKSPSNQCELESLSVATRRGVCPSPHQTVVGGDADFFGTFPDFFPTFSHRKYLGGIRKYLGGKPTFPTFLAPDLQDGFSPPAIPTKKVYGVDSGSMSRMSHSQGSLPWDEGLG